MRCEGVIWRTERGTACFVRIRFRCVFRVERRNQEEGDLPVLMRGDDGLELTS